MVVASRHDGPQLLDAIVAESIAFPSFPALLPALHAAAAGHLAALQRFIAAVDRAQAAPAGELSQGLHESTLCLDLPPPWDPASSTASRAALLARSARSLAPSRFFPFDRDTATGNGIARGCLEWPPTKPASDPPAVPAGNPADQLPRVPILLFEGERDLSTPMAWAREEAARAPGGRLIAVPGAGHSVQLHATDPSVRRILGQFLAGR
jgi:pimeloyl-ACP methyl ester carboxylesterase